VIIYRQRFNQSLLARGPVIAAASLHHATGLRNWQRENSRDVRVNDLRENCSGRAAENVAVEIPQMFPSVSAIYRKVKKLSLHKYVCLAEQEIFELAVRFQQIAL